MLILHCVGYLNTGSSLMELTQFYLGLLLEIPLISVSKTAFKTKTLIICYYFLFSESEIDQLMDHFSSVTYV